MTSKTPLSSVTRADQATIDGLARAIGQHANEIAWLNSGSNRNDQFRWDQIMLTIADLSADFALLESTLINAKGV